MKKEQEDKIRQEERKRIGLMIEKGVETQEQISCPDNMPGCIVFHFKTIRRDLTKEEIINQIFNNY